MPVDVLLNRWIVPLEKRYDFMNLPSGKKIKVPFDQLIIFSTNLEPRDLVDDAFLRRIPYKIEVENPSEKEFRALFKIMCPKMGFEYNEEAVDHLLIRQLDIPRRTAQLSDHVVLELVNRVPSNRQRIRAVGTCPYWFTGITGRHALTTAHFTGNLDRIASTWSG